MRLAALRARDARLVSEVFSVRLARRDSGGEAFVRVPVTGPRVPYRSELERDFLLLCRTQPDIAVVRAGELQIGFIDQEQGAYRRYTPTFVVEHDLRGITRSAIVEVMPRSELWRSRRCMRAKFAAARLWASSQVETTFAVVTDEAMGRGAWLENARLLSPFLDRPVDVDMVATVKRAIGSAEVQIARILEVGRQQGLNQQELLAAIYKMAAAGELQLDLGFPITRGTWVRGVGSQN